MAAAFAGSAVLTTVLEFITGFVLDKLFGRRWWDYSDKKFNIGGYICPQFTVVWGLACLLIMKVVQPAIAFAVGLIWKPVGIAALCLFYAAIITDVILTFPEVKKLRNEIRLIDDLENSLPPYPTLSVQTCLIRLHRLWNLQRNTESRRKKCKERRICSRLSWKQPQTALNNVIRNA